MTTNWPEKIREIRFLEGWKQGEMARQLGVSQATISQWERGMADPPARYHSALNQKLAPHSRDRMLTSLRASVTGSPNLCGLFALRNGAVVLEAQSETGFDLFPLLTREDVGQPIRGKMGPDIDAVCDRLVREGAWEGRIRCAQVCAMAKADGLVFRVRVTHTPFMIENGSWVVRAECRILREGDVCCARHGQALPHIRIEPL